MAATHPRQQNNKPYKPDAHTRHFFGRALTRTHAHTPQTQAPGGSQSSPLLGLLLELHEARAVAAAGAGDAPARDAALAECGAVLDALEAVDYVRTPYWQRRRNQLARLTADISTADKKEE